MSTSVSLHPESRPSGRSHLQRALRSLTSWPEKDRRLFILSYLSRRSDSQVAHELSMEPAVFREEQRNVLRRFMRAGVSGQDTPSV